MNNFWIVGFHAYINEINGSRSIIPSKNLVRQRCAEGFNSGVKGLKNLCRFRATIMIQFSLVDQSALTLRRVVLSYCRSSSWISFRTVSYVDVTDVSGVECSSSVVIPHWIVKNSSVAVKCEIRLDRPSGIRRCDYLPPSHMRYLHCRELCYPFFMFPGFRFLPHQM
jgi:hypothetical protein